MNLNNILKTISKKDLEKMFEEAKNDKSFGGGFRKSAINRELNRRKYKKKGK